MMMIQNSCVLPANYDLSGLSTGLNDLLRPLYFEVPQPVPAPLIGRGWVWHEIREHLSSQLPTNKVDSHLSTSLDSHYYRQTERQTLELAA